jgi:hypothetical protein
MMMIKDFWDILEKFPNIRTLKDVTNVINEIEEDGTAYQYPQAYDLLKEFESSMRSHIYTEWHAQEFYEDADAAHPA